MKALVFGANGQDGHYLVEELVARGIEAVGVSRSGPWRRGDVSRLDVVEALVRDVRPDYIFHLAACSTTRHDALFENHETISTGTLNVLECTRRYCPTARVFIAGSGLQFRNRGEPIDEDTPFEAQSPYAVARIQATYAARYYRSIGLKAYVGFLFHHESPFRKPEHLSRLIASAAQRIAARSGETLHLGDVSVVKEWSFAGDIARAIMTLVDQDAIFEVVVGTGEGHAVEEWLTLCFSAVGLRWEDHVALKPGFRAEYARLISRPERLKALGWSPRLTFESLAETMMQTKFSESSL